MKNKGFTLIELLAVIVILAIIALIATPIILGIINDARTSASERTAELVKSGVQNAYTGYMMKNGGNTPSSVEDFVNTEFYTVESSEVVTTSIEGEGQTPNNNVEIKTSDEGLNCVVTYDKTVATDTKIVITCTGAFPEVKTTDDGYEENVWDSTTRTYDFTANLTESE